VTNQPVSVIFTGKLGDKDIFYRSLSELRGLDCVSQIVFSTWEAEAKESFDFLSKMGSQFDLVVTAAPEPQGWSGNMLSQMISLALGLRQVPEGNRVLKTRPDVFIEPAALTYVISKDGMLNLPDNFAPTSGIFDQKIWVWGVEATVPFYIHDLFFLATKRDMAKLINMDIRYDVLYQMSKEKIHIRRFLHPFINEFPIFERFLNIENVLGATDQFPNEYRYLVLEQLLEDDRYVRILALYYQIVRHYFSNDWGDGEVFQWRDQPEQVEFDAEMTVSEMLLGNTQLKAILPARDIYFQKITDGDYKSCAIGRRFEKAQEYLADLDDIRDACLEGDFDAFMTFAIDAGRNALDQLKIQHVKNET